MKLATIPPIPKAPGVMTDRERFLATMRYESRDRAPLWDFGFWRETLENWQAYGFPAEEISTHHACGSKFFGMDECLGGGLNSGLCPRFESRVLEDRGDAEVVMDGDGVKLLRQKRMGSIPRHLEHTLVDRTSWEQHFRWRLDPNHPDRKADNYAEQLALWRDESRNPVIAVSGGSSYGVIRNWMGVEAVSYLVYDEPELFGEMVEMLCDCSCACIEEACRDGAKFDAVSFWEDMCYNAGPLLSPQHFREFLIPFYQRVMEVAHRYGIEFAWVDCDGKIDTLAPLWLEAGVNVMFPIEVGVWGQDPVDFRRRYGKDLRLMGGFDKHILARGKREIEAEVKRLNPLVEEGGFIPFCDHRVPPDVPLENYLHYLYCARKIWAGLDEDPRIFTLP